MKVKRICETCGVKLKKTQERFCSQICFGKWQSENKNGVNSHNWRGGKVKRKCKYCGKEFYVFPCFIKNSRGKFCSRKCKERWHSKNMSGKNSPNWKPKIVRYCIECGKKMELQECWMKPKGKNRGLFCSFKCFTKWVSENKLGKNHWCWKGGLSLEPYGIDFNGKLKEQIRKRDNYICRGCEQTEKELGYKLSIHHVDYNKKNNKPVNLISLCKSCHAQTNNDRQWWIDYFLEI